MADIPVNASDGQVTVDVVTNGQVIYAYDFRADKVDDLKAIYRTVAGVETNLVGGDDFTATGLGTATGGTITFTTFPGTVAGSKVTIYRDIEIERLSDYQQDLFADDLNLEQDTIFMIMQELARDIGRAVKSAIGIAPPAAGHVLLSDGAGGVTEGPTGDQIDNAQGYAAAAAASATASSTSATNSAGSATLAQQWASRAEDDPVPGGGGLFSAFHYMKKAQAVLATITNTMAGWIHAATAKSPLVAADEFGFWDSVSTGLRKITYANLLSQLKTNIQTGLIIQTSSLVYTTAIPTKTVATGYQATGAKLALPANLRDTNSKVLIRMDFVLGATGTAGEHFEIRRGATSILGAAASHGGAYVPDTNSVAGCAIEVLDSPANVTPAQYELYWNNVAGAAGNRYVGRRGADTAFNVPVLITLMEIAG